MMDAKLRKALSAWLLGLAVAVSLAGCASLPQDGADAKVMRFDNLRDMRYGEVFRVGGNRLTHNLEAAFYNTTGLNDSADPRNTCPEALWAKVNPEMLKKQYDVLDVFKNGPRHWTMDWIELPVGTERNFDGLKARWMYQVKLPEHINLEAKGYTGYRPTKVERKSQMGFIKGKPVFILDDMKGNPWVMQAYSLIADPSLTYEGLKTLGSKLKLAPGWKYRVQVLDQDLTIKAVDGIAHIVQDDLGNTYDLCAGGSSNFKP